MALKILAVGAIFCAGVLLDLLFKPAVDLFLALAETPDDAASMRRTRGHSPGLHRGAGHLCFALIAAGLGVVKYGPRPTCFRALGALCAALMALSMLSVPVRAQTDFETEIAAEGGKWAKYYEQADLEGLMTLCVDDAIVALHGQPALFGITAIREYFSTRLAS